MARRLAARALFAPLVAAIATAVPVPDFAPLQQQITERLSPVLTSAISFVQRDNSKPPEHFAALTDSQIAEASASVSDTHLVTYEPDTVDLGTRIASFGRWLESLLPPAVPVVTNADLVLTDALPLLVQEANAEHSQESLPILAGGGSQPAVDAIASAAQTQIAVATQLLPPTAANDIATPEPVAANGEALQTARAEAVTQTAARPAAEQELTQTEAMPRQEADAAIVVTDAELMLREQAAQPAAEQVASLGEQAAFRSEVTVDEPARSSEAGSSEPTSAPSLEEKAKETLVVASLHTSTGSEETPAVESALNPEPQQSRAEATQAPVMPPLSRNGTMQNEKQVYASLVSSTTASDTRQGMVDLSPITSRALTSSSASPEKYASLSSQEDAMIADLTRRGIIPPERQRASYEGPSDRPISIGKRKYVEDKAYAGLGSPEALLEALRWMGSNAKSIGVPPSLWCADFMNFVLRRSGLDATGSRAARSYLKYGKQIDGPRVGAIAIFSRGKNGGHIGIVRGTDGDGNPIIISGNHNHKVAEAKYPKHRVLAYVVPRDAPSSEAKAAR